MAVLAAELKRGYLRVLYRAASTTVPVVTLLAALNTFQDNCYQSVKAGRLLIGSAGNGHSSTFKAPDPAFQLNPMELFSLSEEYMAIYTAAVANLAVQTPPIASPTDLQIFNEMMSLDSMQTIREYQNDYTALRFSTAGPGLNT